MSLEEFGEWSAAAQGRVLCQHYVAQRSLKAGAQLRKIRMLFHGYSGQVSNHLSDKMLEILTTMEELNPGVYDSCSSKLKITMSTDESVRATYNKIVEELLKSGITWALGADCVSQGHTSFLPVILDCFEETCSGHVVGPYLKEIGGWAGVVDHYYNKVQSPSVTSDEDKLSQSFVDKTISKSMELFRKLISDPEIVSRSLLLLFITLLLILAGKLYSFFS